MTAAQSVPEPTPTALADVLRTALERTATEHPELAGRLPWHEVSDPDAVARLDALDAEVTRIRAALAAGRSLEDLGLTDGGLDQIMRDRGLA
jgi:hypothetical protein